MGQFSSSAQFKGTIESKDALKDIKGAADGDIYIQPHVKEKIKGITYIFTVYWIWSEGDWHILSKLDEMDRFTYFALNSGIKTTECRDCIHRNKVGLNHEGIEYPYCNKHDDLAYCDSCTEYVSWRDKIRELEQEIERLNH